MKYKPYSLSITSSVLFLVPSIALAHCPLCTAGAGVAALGAKWLGFGTMSIGVFIGAFAMATGLWVHRLLKKQYVMHQMAVLGVISFLTIVIPLIPLMGDYTSLYIASWGAYGRTFLVSRFLLGSILGGVLMCVFPRLSQGVSRMRGGKIIAYQGIILTLFTLMVVAVIIELIV